LLRSRNLQASERFVPKRKRLVKPQRKAGDEDVVVGPAHVNLADCYGRA
jgi:hypothetical protein